MKHLSAIKTYVESLSLTAYCIVAGVIALLGSLTLISAAFLTARALGLDAILDNPVGSPSIEDGFAAIIFAPVVETFLLAVGLRLLSGLGRTGSCVASALVWGVLHGVFAPIRFFGSVWSFFVFGFGYLLWRQRSRKHAFAAAAVPHAIVNTVGFAIWASVA